MDEYTASDDEVCLQGWHQSREHLHHTRVVTGVGITELTATLKVTTGNEVSLIANSGIKNCERHSQGHYGRNRHRHGGIVPSRYRSLFR